jgi:hypothetical protein
MAHDTAHPARDAFLRLAALLLWYGLGGVALLVAVGYLLVFSAFLGQHLAAVLGGSRLARVAGFCVAFIVLLGAEVGLGGAVGAAYGIAMKRWPDNPVEKLVKWVNKEQL